MSSNRSSSVICAMILVLGIGGAAEESKCYISRSNLNEIRGYQNVVDDIIRLYTTGKFKNKTFDTLAQLTDMFGSRMTGSNALEDAIDCIVDNATREGFKVSTENVTAPYWVRYRESLKMLTPRKTDLEVISLGFSVATPPGGIVAEVLVVSSCDELDSFASKAQGKIILFDISFEQYDISISYRLYGAKTAAKVGAVASLIRSLGNFPLSPPKTGLNFYNDSRVKIPAAAISIEDAMMLHRLQNLGENITLHLTIEAETLPDTTSRNTIIQIKGSTDPEEEVVVSGHLDSWDVGVGAVDNGGGAAISWMASRALKKLKLIPRRTYSTVLFTAHEQGSLGGQAYFRARRNNLQRFQLMMMADSGLYLPFGIDFKGQSSVGCLMKNIVSLTAQLEPKEVRAITNYSDLADFERNGLPIGYLGNTNVSRYYWYYHSKGDRVGAYVSEDLDKIAAFWTAVSYVAANVSFKLPQESLKESNNV